MMSSPLVLPGLALTAAAGWAPHSQRFALAVIVLAAAVLLGVSLWRVFRA